MCMGIPSTNRLLNPCKLNSEEGLNCSKELGVSEAMTNLELRRYKYDDIGQAPSYFYGYLIVKEMRSKAQEKSGDQFRLKCFNDCKGCEYSRSFNIDYSKSNFEVSVFGRNMGTPDGDKIDAFLKSGVSSGIIDDLIVLATGIEGGARNCVVVNDIVLRKETLMDRQRMPADLRETSFIMTSTDLCSN